MLMSFLRTAIMNFFIFTDICVFTTYKVWHKISLTSIQDCIEAQYPLTVDTNLFVQ